MFSSMPAEYKEYVDTDTGISRVRGNKALYRKMLVLFLQNKEFDAFDEALASGDTHRCAEVAHGIKGMTGNLSLPRIYDVSTRLTEEFRAGNPNREAIDEYHMVLQKTLEYVTAIVSALEEG